MEDVISRGGAVFVHCMGGISRSPAVVAAYLMRYRGLDVGGAMRVVRAGNPRSCPNEGFVRQLVEWEAHCAAAEAAARERPGEGPRGPMLHSIN